MNIGVTVSSLLFVMFINWWCDRFTFIATTIGIHIFTSCSQLPATLQLGSTGAKVAELQRVLKQIGYGSLLAGQGGGGGGSSTASTNSGIDGKFGWHQLQDDLIQIPGIVLLVTIYRIFNKMDGTPVLQ